MHHRRTFLRDASALSLTAASYGRVRGANDAIGVGFIGYGLIGKRHVLDFQEQPDVRMVAVCDAHRRRRDEAKQQIGDNVRDVADFRRVLDDRDVQAVVVSTPDHWHALMTMLACAAGKDVYVEKPLTLFVREGRWLVDVARRQRRLVQVGTQQRSGQHYQRARRLLQDGALGTIHSVRMQAYRNIMPGFGRPADSAPPAELDWNMFLGPAPQRPYNTNRGLYHFRWFWDYSGGQMTNLGHHSLDIVHWFLEGVPQAVTSVGGRFALEDNGETPDTQDAFFEFQSAGGRRWTAVWSHREASAGPTQTGGLEFFGTRGTLVLSRRGYVLTPDRRIAPQNRVPRFTGDPPVGGVQRVAEGGREEYWTEARRDDTGSDREQFTGHVRNFLDCVKTRATPIADLESGHRVSTLCHLANLSLRLGRKLRWDAAREQIVGDDEANRQLIRPYREPWDAELRALLG